jgi:hypothetical protein
MDLPLKHIARIAEALESLQAVAETNCQLAKNLAEETVRHNLHSEQILQEDLAFRREQAAKAEQQQALFLRMFIGQAQPGAGKELETPISGTVPRRPRHTQEYE